jgi:ribonucleoside-diphosphate reductase alpha chain
MTIKFTYEEALKDSLLYFEGDDLAANVFVTKYALTNKQGDFLEKDPASMHERLSSEFARIEEKYDNAMSKSEIYALLKDFSYVIPQGSPMSGIGNNNQIQSISNCFVIESPHDSYGGILKTDQELVQIAKRRGGVGFDISNIRPKGMTTGNAARTTDGIEVFMDRFSNSCREVAQGGRRGALMLTISVHHPQIHDFIKIKRDLTRVTGANISIRVTDEFMNAVNNDSEVQLRWPVDASNPEITENIVARDLWHDLIETAHASAEPGILFWDTAKKMTPSDIYSEQGFGSTSTNPCGEIILSPHDSCRLMLMNLTSFVKNPWTKNSEFNFGEFGNKVQKAQRLMDDMIDLEIEQVDKIISKIDNDPEPDAIKKIERDLWENVRTQALKGRRTGLGITGLGDTIAMMGMKYGSDDSIHITEEIYKWLALNSYESSIILAKERGAFPVWDYEKEKEHPFVSKIVGSLLQHRVDDYRTYGRRNIANTTTAPAGSVSVLTKTTSGIEPAFMLHYTRRKKLTGQDESGRIDFIDKSGDEWQEYTVYHHGFKRWMNYMDEINPAISTGLTDDERASMSPYSNSTANEIDWVAKVRMQAAAQKWVCHAISNTTNLPADADVETVKKVYMTGWELGCKGITVYRDGSRSGVLVSTESKETNDSFKENSAPKRPEELECDVHQVSISGEPWTILIGLLAEKPYEIFGGKSEYVEIPRKYRVGYLIKRHRKTMNSIYDLKFGESGNEVIVKDIVKIFDNPNHSAFTRVLSLALRHGAPVHYICEQLQKDRDADLFSFSKVIARCLKKYIIDGTKPGNGSINCNCETRDNSNIVYQEGCATCLSCGYAKCG